MTYAEWVLEVAPPWLVSGPNGRAFLQGLAGPLDGNFDRVRQAAKADLPLTAPWDALALIGEETGLDRGFGEPEDSYRARLQSAFTLWLLAGTAVGLLYALYAAGYQNPILQIQGGAKQYSLAGSTGDPSADLIIASMATPVHLGGSPAELWSDLAVLIVAPWPSRWAGVAPGDGSAEQQAVANLVTRWKPGHVRCVKLNAVNGPTWDGGETWDGGASWDSGTVTVWTPPG